MNKPFLSTKDCEAANALKKAGYTLVSENDGRYIFINSNTLTFDHGSLGSKVFETNKLCV